MSDEKHVLGCVPVDAKRLCGIDYKPYPDSIKVQCELCHLEVWLGPKQQEMRSLHNIPVWCMFCCVANMDVPQRIIQLTDK